MNIVTDIFHQFLSNKKDVLYLKNYMSKNIFANKYSRKLLFLILALILVSIWLLAT